MIDLENAPTFSPSARRGWIRAGLLAALFVAPGCLGRAESSVEGSQTHFLSCEVDNDCQLATLRCSSGLCVDSSGAPVPAPSSSNGGVGDPCISADEASPDWGGALLSEVNVDTSGQSCGTGLVCLASRFQGRVTCPGGQASANGECLTTSGEPVRVPVSPQLASSPAEERVICSCRCAGPGPGGDFCSCPSGMRCETLVSGSSEYAGSYCTYPGASAL
jgi:hypothetical protein